MIKLVPKDLIETIVGVERKDSTHMGKAVSQTKTVYILHSKDCRNIKECKYSVSLGLGISEEIWEDFQDQPVHLSIENERLVPKRMENV